MLQAVERMVHKARPTSGRRLAVEHRKRQAAAAYNPAGVDQFAYDAELAGTVFRSKYGTMCKPRGDAPSVVAQSDTLLRVLQITDIHPDLDYSEVSPS